MVAQLLRLRLAILANTFRRRPAQLVGMVLGLVYGSALTIFMIVTLAGLRSETPDIARVVVTVVGAVIVLGFLVLPLVFGVDDMIDPRRFWLFGIDNNRLAVGLAIAALVSVPVAAVAILSIAQVATWSRGPLPVLVSIASALLIVPTCVLASRVSSAVAAALLSSRRSRDGSGIVLTLVLAIGAPLVALLAIVDWQSQGLPIMRRIAAVVWWTPFGSAWSAPGDAALGSVDVALIKLAISLAFLVVLALAWRGLVAAMLARPPREAMTRRYSGLGWFERLPATPFGVIAARSLSYWSRDSRYRIAVAVIPLLPIVMVAALLIAGVPTEVIVWIPVPVMCLFLGWTVHNDIAYDSTAFWVHVSADTRGSDDRWGRIVPALVVGVPLVVLGSLATALVAGDITILPGIAGFSACVLLVALGVSSLVSASFPYPAVRPGDSPFAQPQGIGTSGSMVQSLSFLATIVIAAPVLLPVLLAPGAPTTQFLVLAIGVVGGIGVLVGGVYWGGHVVDRRAPELLAFTLQN